MKLRGREHSDGTGTASLRWVIPAALALIAVLGCASLAQAAQIAIAPVRAPRVTEFPLPSNEFLPGEITQGPDGNLWFANRSGIVGKPVSEQTPVDGINRITLAGAVTEFPLPEQTRHEVSGITVGPDGNVWFADGFQHVGYITMTGQIIEFKTTLRPIGVTSGQEGNVWFTQVGQVVSRGEIGRVTPGGQITTFPLPESGAFPGAITTGAEGSLWFVVHREGSPGIGRLTPEGQFSIFGLPNPKSSLVDLALGPDGNLWFTNILGRESASIGRITPEGQISEYALPKETRWPGAIASGPDGRLWFTYGWGEIGRITPGGRFSFVSIPHGEPEGLVSGPEESIWYTANTEGPCEGGGGGCQLRVPTPGVVGRITPGALAVEIIGKRIGARGHWVKIRLKCAEGNAADVCRGSLRLRVRVPRKTGRGMQSLVLAQRSYALPVDASRKIALRLRPGPEGLLPHHRSRASVTATIRGGHTSGRQIVITR